MFKKLLLKLFFKDTLEIERIDNAKLKDWLYVSYENRGYSQYYTMRKKFISNLMGNGLSWEDYLICLGRLQELRALNDNITKEVNIRKQKEKKEKKANSLTSSSEPSS